MCSSLARTKFSLAATSTGRNEDRFTSQELESSSRISVGQGGRGIQAGQRLGAGEGELKGTQEGWMGKRGEGRYFSRREKRRGSATCAFPNQAGAKPGIVNTTSEIT
jgi:hypothetical protein